MLREEFLQLLRMDQAFREEVRRELLTEDLLALPKRFDQLSELVQELVEAVQALTEAQLRHSEQIQRHSEQIQRHSEQIQALTEAQRRTEETLQRQGERIKFLIEAQGRTEETLQRQGERIEFLIEAQGRTEQALQKTQNALQELIGWQQGEKGRREGERYEREMCRRAFTLFNGGDGGSPDYPSVQQRLGAQLESSSDGRMLEPEEDPFLADLIWWKGERVAVVEISLRVNGTDVLRAAQRAETLKRAGADAVAVVIGKDWAGLTKDLATDKQVEWNVGLDLSEGFINLRRISST